MKDRVAVRAYKALVRKYFQYSRMIIPPSENDWPCYQAALILVDGYKPNPCTGDHHTNGTEARIKPLIKIIVGSPVIWEGILQKIMNGLLHIQSQENFDSVNCSYIYQEDEANMISFVDINDQPLQETPMVESSEEVDSLSYYSILKDYTPAPHRGTHKPPYEYLYKCTTKKQVKQQVNAWRRLKENAQLKEF